MKVKQLEAIYHSEATNEPYIYMDMLSKDCQSILFRLWWLLWRWRRTELTLAVVKESGRWI